MDYDAASCYNRIMASLTSRAHRQNKAITLINAATLQEAKFILKTQLGTSEHYSHSDLHPLYGIGQGARSFPAVWATISSTLFTMYDKEAHGTIYHSPDHSIQIKIYMVGFVNDTSGSTNDFLQPHLLKETHYIQQATMDALGCCHS